MSYISFKQRWLGLRTDYDKVYGYQCVDLIKRYAAEEFGLKPGSWGNAIKYWSATHADVLTKFTKVTGSAGQPGDVVVFFTNGRTDYGGEGHIGIVDRVDAAYVYTLEQNGATGDGDGMGGDEIRIRAIPRTRVAGLLRPKQTQGVSEMANATQVNTIYKGVLHREGDPGGIANYTGRDANAVVAEMLASPERARLEAGITGARTEAARVPQLLAEVGQLKEQLSTKPVEVRIEVPVPVEVEKVVEVERKIVVDPTYYSMKELVHALWRKAVDSFTKR